ncbi:hypothetical protein BJ165DRAFT_1598504 [Panaeolus papilionaceus]|nr:hypothetical protein BJ165DRAFT_1598504 [Panaeolus papilionaceus]
MPIASRWVTISTIALPLPILRPPRQHQRFLGHQRRPETANNHEKQREVLGEVFQEDTKYPPGLHHDELGLKKKEKEAKDIEHRVEEGNGKKIPDAMAIGSLGKAGSAEGEVEDVEVETSVWERILRKTRAFHPSYTFLQEATEADPNSDPALQHEHTQYNKIRLAI